MRWTYKKLSQEYATLWDGMAINRDVDKIVEKIVAHRAAYEQIEALTNVPWYFIGILDMREGGGSARTHLHNGDSLKRRTLNVPAGRPLSGNGPFSFVESACDALRQKGYDQITDWSVEQMAYCFERYNGFGYRDYRKMLSPYLWGGTNHQEPGKYIRDGVFSKSVMDPQIGCMPLLKRITDLHGVSLHSAHGAVADVDTPSPASNRKTDEMMSPAATGTAVVTAGASAAAFGPDAVNQFTQVKGLVSGMDIKTALIALFLFVAVSIGLPWLYARVKS